MKNKIEDFNDDELMQELIRRRNKNDLGATSTFIEDDAESIGEQLSYKRYAASLDAKSDAEDGSAKRCPRCGALCSVKQKRAKRRIQSSTGVHFFRRNRHHCAACKKGFFPLDIELELPEKGEVTSKLEARLLDMAIHSPFEEAAQRWEIHHSTHASENLFRRIIERVGKRAQNCSRSILAESLRAPNKEFSSLLVASVDGSMLPTRGEDDWREVKLGVVYRGENRVQQGKRGFISEADYVASINGIADFSKEMKVILHKEKADDVDVVVWLGDGASWVWNLAADICPNAVCILDWFHAVENAEATALTVFGKTPWRRDWVERVKFLLHNSEIELLLEELEACCFLVNGKERDEVIRLKNYFTNNKERIRYSDFRRRELPIGSGVIEGSHRHVLQKRLKLAGQHWNPSRLGRIAFLRAALATSGPKAFHRAINVAARQTAELHAA